MNCKGKILSGKGISFDEKAHELIYVGDEKYECMIEGCGKTFRLSEESNE